MLFIEVPDMNDSVSTLSIDGKEYELRFTYNVKFDYWSFGLNDEKGNPIIYNNELSKVAMAVSQGSFIEQYGIKFGPDWKVTFTK